MIFVIFVCDFCCDFIFVIFVCDFCVISRELLRKKSVISPLITLALTLVRDCCVLELIQKIFVKMFMSNREP